MNELVKNEMSFADMQVAASTIAKSGLFKAWSTPEQVMTLMLLCKAEGSDPLSAVNRYDMVQGRITKRSQAMLDDFIKGGGRVQWLESTDTVAKGKFFAPNGSEHIETYTIEEARRAKLANKDNWTCYPKVMLRNRCVAFALRAVYPSVTSLMLSENEAVDISETINVTPAQTQKIEGNSKTEKILSTLKKSEVKYEEAKEKVEVVEEVEYISREQQKLLFAKFKESGMNEQELRNYLAREFGDESTTKIPKTGFESVLDYVETHKAVNQE